MLRRSGTVFVQPVYDEAKKSAIVPFEFNNEQAQIVEIAEGRIRFIDEQGLLTYTAVSVSSVVDDDPFVVEAAGLAASVGDQVALAGLPASLNLNGVVCGVTAVSGDEYTLDATYSNPEALDVSGATVARVYHVDAEYQEEDVSKVRVIQSVDVLYLFCDGYRPKKLARFGATNWTLTDIEFVDGPYDEENEDGVTLTPDATGNASTNALGTASASSNSTGNTPANAFDEDKSTFWESNVDQSGILIFTPTTAFAAKSYSIYLAKNNTNTSYAYDDFAPGDWTFEGYDGSDWVVLDARSGYVLYDGGRSLLFELNNETSYTQYRLNISACTRNGNIKPRVAALVIMSQASSTVTLTASGTAGVNGGSGFVSTDVGRLVRVQGTDTIWRPYRITAVNSTTEIEGTIEDAAFPNTDALSRWKLGIWSDTTGWPTCGIFYDDRMFMGGSAGSPDTLVGSVQGAYETMREADYLGEVLDDSAINVKLRSRKLARIRWLETDEQAILIGTGSGEWTVTAPDTQKSIGPTNIRARRSTKRGSADIQGVAIDKQVLYVQRARRQVRELAYVYEVDGYKAPSMSIFASHIGSDRFADIDYAAEPHSIVWLRQDSGKLAGLTYNRDENVVGWHRQDVGGQVESIAVIPSNDERQDILWMVVKRTVGEVERRYIERLSPFWDFDSEVNDAKFVDCGLSGTFGAPQAVVYGLGHLEGEAVVGLMDGVPFDPITVEGGAIELPQEATDVVVGLQYTSELETSRIDAGSASGTAQGKSKRMQQVRMEVWDTYGGEVGLWDEVNKAFVWDAINYDEAPYSEMETNELRSGITEPIAVDAGYSKRGTVAVRQTLPLPFNLISIMPQMHTQDG